MPTSRTCLLLLCLLAPPLAAARQFDAEDIGGGSFITRQNSIKPKAWDKNELGEAVEETRALLDGLAREARSLSPTAQEALLADLDRGFKLDDAVKPARKALARSWKQMELQDRIRSLQAQLEGLSGTAADAAEKQLLEAQASLVQQVEGVRELLFDLHKDLKEAQLRDFRAWIMVSEGRLRKLREAAEAAASPATAGATPSPTPAAGPGKPKAKQP